MGRAGPGLNAPLDGLESGERKREREKGRERERERVRVSE